jgi:two-component system, response regulator RegA
MSEHSVLLVDDEVDFVDALAERLEVRGLEVVKTHGGAEALQAAEGRVFDAIVLDMAMPEMNGLETLEELLKINPDLQVILLTGRATLEQAAAAIRIGALDLMEKPAEISTLVSKIELAATRRWSLEQKRIEESVADLIRRKGW